MAHGGLNINLKYDYEKIHYSQCCQLSTTNILQPSESLWNNPRLLPLRELNNNNEWGSACWLCNGNELAGMGSFRKSMLDKFGVRTDLSGPLRIDLLFDISCNLACRICGPHASTMWQKQLTDNNIKYPIRFNAVTRTEEVIALLKTLDLSNLEMVQYCGGETLMGNNYWKVTDVIASLAPLAKEKLSIGFQTNGTQTINPRYYELIDKFQSVIINISLDGTNDRFNYLRWPADWHRVTDNIFKMREELPNNVMFLVEETFSIFNLFYHNEVEEWTKKNFSTNRLGDVIPHSKHLVMHDLLNVNNVTQEYIDALGSNPIKNLIPVNWRENPLKIRQMIADITRFDNIRNQTWCKTFPEVVDFYSRYL